MLICDYTGILTLASKVFFDAYFLHLKKVFFNTELPFWRGSQ